MLFSSRHLVPLVTLSLSPNQMTTIAWRGAPHRCRKLAANKRRFSRLGTPRMPRKVVAVLIGLHPAPPDRLFLVLANFLTTGRAMPAFTLMGPTLRWLAARWERRSASGLGTGAPRAR